MPVGMNPSATINPILIIYHLLHMHLIQFLFSTLFATTMNVYDTF